jgi:hypothetical protein
MPFLGIQHVDNSRFFVDKYLALWRSPTWGQFIRIFVPLDVGSTLRPIQYVDWVKN